MSVCYLSLYSRSEHCKRTLLAGVDLMDICAAEERFLFRSAYVMSHNYPADYRRNLDCQCDVSTDPGQKILLTFSDFAVEWSEDCYKDILR